MPTEKSEIKHIDVSVEFASLIQIEKKIEKTELEKIVLIKIPSEIYPEIRNTIIFLFEKSGFKKINIDEKIDFLKLYESRKSEKVSS